MNILQVDILSNDLLATENFYSEQLGLELLSKDKNAISVAAGRSILRFSATGIKKPVYHFAFNIPGNQLNEALAYINTRAEILPVSTDEIVADFSNWNAKAFYFHDNNG